MNGNTVTNDDDIQDVPSLSAAFNWAPRPASAEERAQQVFDEQDMVGLVHPIYVIPPQVVERARRQFAHSMEFGNAV